MRTESVMVHDDGASPTPVIDTHSHTHKETVTTRGYLYSHQSRSRCGDGPWTFLLQGLFVRKEFKMLMTSLVQFLSKLKTSKTIFQPNTS